MKELSPYWANAFGKPSRPPTEAQLAGWQRKRTEYRGSGNPRAKFTDEQRRAVAREARQPGANLHEIARRHGFSSSYVWNIKQGTRGSVGEQ